MPLDPHLPAVRESDSAGPPAEKLLSRGEAARYVGLPVYTVYQWARTGRLPYKVTLGGHLRFSRSDLDAALVRQTSVEGADDLNVDLNRTAD
ncbi:MAG: helix-turn-helix domain-containing protein [Acidimicrobiales bacterium]